MIKGIAHVCFTVADLDTAMEFYCDALGLGHAFDFVNDDGERFGVYLKAGRRTFVELFEGEVPEDAKCPSYRHFCLEVDDIESTVAELRERGVEVSDPHYGDDNSWQAWITDPDGNRIELHAYTEESKQAPHLD